MQDMRYTLQVIDLRHPLSKRIAPETPQVRIVARINTVKRDKLLQRTSAPHTIFLEETDMNNQNQNKNQNSNQNRTQNQNNNQNSNQNNSQNQNNNQNYKSR